MAAVTLHPYQQRWVTTRPRLKIGMFARQTGKTFTTTLEIVDSCLQAAAEGRSERWVILSRGERQAREAMDEGIKRHARAYRAAIEAAEGEFRGESGTVFQSVDVTLPGGSRISALPANPDTARGFSANVFLDEFAFHRDSRAIWRALFPVISRPGLRLIVTSTPNGKGNMFYDLMTAGPVDHASPWWLDSPAGAMARRGDPDRWYRQVTDIYGAVADGLDRDVDMLKSGIKDPDAWAQEYELQWLDEASAWLPYELINACEHPDAGQPDAYEGKPVFIGVDIGIRSDLFVVWVVEQVGDVFWTREIIARRRISFAEQDALLDDVFHRYKVARCCIDQTGMGEKVVEDAQRRHGRHRVEGVLFTAPNKIILASAGKEAFEDRRIRIPAGDPALRADLHKLQRQSSATGAPRFVAESDAAGHADRAWACFLAIHAAGNPPAPIEYAVPDRPRHYASAGRAEGGYHGGGAW